MIFGLAAEGLARSAWTEAHLILCVVERVLMRVSVGVLDESDVYAMRRLAPLAASRLTTASPIPVD